MTDYVTVSAVTTIATVEKLAPLIEAITEGIMNNAAVTDADLDALRESGISPQHLAWGKLLEGCAEADLDWLVR